MAGGADFRHRGQTASWPNPRPCEVWLADFERSIGGEIPKTRPVVAVVNDAGNVVVNDAGTAVVNRPRVVA